MSVVSCIGMEFSKKLRKLMAERRYSQEMLAREVNVSQTLVSLWTRGKGIPDLREASRLAVVFGVSLDYLADDTKAEPPQDDAGAEDERSLLRHFRVLKRTRGMDVDEAMARLDGGGTGEPATRLLLDHQLARMRVVVDLLASGQGRPEILPFSAH